MPEIDITKLRRRPGRGHLAHLRTGEAGRPLDAGSVAVLQDPPRPSTRRFAASWRPRSTCARPAPELGHHPRRPPPAGSPPAPPRSPPPATASPAPARWRSPCATRCRPALSRVTTQHPGGRRTAAPRGSPSGSASTTLTYACFSPCRARWSSLRLRSRSSGGEARRGGRAPRRAGARAPGGAGAATFLRGRAPGGIGEDVEPGLLHRPDRAAGGPRPIRSLTPWLALCWAPNPGGLVNRVLRPLLFAAVAGLTGQRRLRPRLPAAATRCSREAPVAPWLAVLLLLCAAPLGRMGLRALGLRGPVAAALAIALVAPMIALGALSELGEPLVSGYRLPCGTGRMMLEMSVPPAMLAAGATAALVAAGLEARGGPRLDRAVRALAALCGVLAAVLLGASLVRRQSAPRRIATSTRSRSWPRCARPRGCRRPSPSPHARGRRCPVRPTWRAARSMCTTSISRACSSAACAPSTRLQRCSSSPGAPRRRRPASPRGTSKKARRSSCAAIPRARCGSWTRKEGTPTSAQRSAAATCTCATWPAR